MRLFSSASARVLHALVVASLFVAAGCGGGGSSGSNPVPPFGNSICDPQTNVSLAYPNNTQGNFPTNVPTSIGRVEIVANGNNNALGTSFTQWDTVLVPQFGQTIQGGFLTATSDPGGPHPYASDFYYNSSIGTLQFGTTYTVYLNVPNSNCQPVAIGQFQT